jgi:hypothetical protein
MTAPGDCGALIEAMLLTQRNDDAVLDWMRRGAAAARSDGSAASFASFR